jgi:hypothetical protein
MGKSREDYLRDAERHARSVKQWATTSMWAPVVACSGRSLCLSASPLRSGRSSPPASFGMVLVGRRRSARSGTLKLRPRKR